jgi:DNA-binding NarL/FixJ family response regulator
MSGVVKVSRIARLTRREWQVFEVLGSGLTYKETGDKLGISERTVNVHATHIREKLGAHSIIQALEGAFGPPVIPFTEPEEGPPSGGLAGELKR